MGKYMYKSHDTKEMQVAYKRQPGWVGCSGSVIKGAKGTRTKRTI